MDTLSKGTASSRVDSEPPELQSQLLQSDSTLTVAQSVSLTLDNDFLAVVGTCYCLWPVRKQKKERKKGRVDMGMLGQMRALRASRVAAVIAAESWANPVIINPSCLCGMESESNVCL